MSEQRAYYQRIDPDGTARFISKDEYDAGIRASDRGVDPGFFYIQGPTKPRFVTLPATEYGMCVDSSIGLHDGKHYGEAGLDNFVALVRRQWGEGKTVVLTGSHVFIPPPAGT